MLPDATGEQASQRWSHARGRPTASPTRRRRQEEGGGGEVDEGWREVARAGRMKGRRGRRCTKVEEEDGDGGAEERNAMVSRLVGLLVVAVGEMVA